MKLTIAERLLYSTVRITSVKHDNTSSYSSGFFMVFDNRNNTACPAIVTNKHVISHTDKVSIAYHVKKDNIPSGCIETVVIPIQEGKYITHPDAEIDLCALPIASQLVNAEASGKPFFYQHIDFSIVPDEADWDKFDAIEDVVMIGCPNGIYDEVNNLPLVRRGITASPLGKKFNGKNEFLIDLACFPGSSGSPVFIFDSSGFFDKRSGSVQFDSQRLILIGVLYAGPVVSNSGEIMLGHSPRVVVQSMMHLGCVIRSSELLKIDQEFRRLSIALSGG
jgi:hypothetical protein